MVHLSSQFFIDGGDPKETLEAKELLGHIDGQTTNPSLVSKNPDVMKRVIDGKRLTQEEALNEYKKIITNIAKVTSGPISIQIIADQATPKEEMLRQARIYKNWIPNAVVKFPCTDEGLAAAEEFCQEWSVNITLNFSQEQAAAVHAATLKATHDVFISPFVGRLDDKRVSGMDVVANILKMYGSWDSRVKVLTASVRRVSHILYALKLGSYAITIPFKLFLEWKGMGFPSPLANFKYETDTRPIPYQEIPLKKDWREYNLKHDLTDTGLTKFMEDWRSVVRV